MIQGKIWGNTQNIFNKNNVEIHRIEIDKGGYCSKHKHIHKYNAFFVENGSLEISIWKKDYELCDKTTISDTQMTVVSPGEEHMFRALEDTVAYEIYWVELTNDIVRSNHGGIDKQDS